MRVGFLEAVTAAWYYAAFGRFLGCVTRWVGSVEVSVVFLYERGRLTW